MIDSLSWYKPFLIGGASGITSILIIHPIDVIKTTLQLNHKITINNVIKQTYTKKGLPGFYQGLSAAIMRQSIYTTIRIGLFPMFVNIIPDAETNLLPKMLCGVMSGGIASFISTPTDLILTRMQSDNSSFNKTKYNYNNIFDGLNKVIKNEGIFKLWNGSKIIILRAMTINSILLPSYNYSKDKLIYNGYNKDSIIVRGLPSVISGISTALISQPLDIIKAHIQSNNLNRNKSLYKSVNEFLVKNKITGLFRGLPVYMFRIVPYTILTTTFVDTLGRL